MSFWMIFDPAWSPDWMLARYATLLRATLLLLLVAGVAGLLRRAPASVRAVLWATALLALLPLPELRALPLHWSAHVVPAPLAAPMVAIGATRVLQSSPEATAFPWTSILGVVWLTGIAVVALRLISGWRAFGAVAAAAPPITDSHWRQQLIDGCTALGVRRRVRLLRTDSLCVPVTWGTFRPAILLPAAADQWPEAHRRAVLLHELAHIRRLDCLLGLLGRAACAFWWFHPGAWWAAHRLEVERERACDELVLRAGVRPSEYARCLLSIADAANRGPSAGSTAVAAGLLRRPRVKERIRAILASPAASRADGGRWAPTLALAAAVTVAMVVGSMRISPRPQVHWATLESGGWAERAYAAQNIARFGDPRSVAALDAALAREPHPSVRATAAFGKRLRTRAAQQPYVRFGWGPHTIPARLAVASDGEA